MQATLLPSSRKIGDTNQWSQVQLIQNNSRIYGTRESAASSLAVALHSREKVPTPAVAAAVSVCSFAAAAAATTSSFSLSVATCASTTAAAAAAAVLSILQKIERLLVLGVTVSTLVRCQERRPVRAACMPKSHQRCYSTRFELRQQRRTLCWCCSSVCGIGTVKCLSQVPETKELS
jgi:hypothetical protein